MDDLFNSMLEAHEAVRPQVSVTPLERSPVLSATLDCDVLLKCEHLQPTGSFKIRGATNRVRILQGDERRGVFTASTGNHGLAVARAGALANIPVTVYVSENAVPSKLRDILALGAKLEIINGDSGDAEIAGRRRAEQEGLVYISPYNDPYVVAGQGTLGVELMEQDRDLDAVFIAVGAGGLIGGTGLAIKATNPKVCVVGVWPEASPCMLRALEAGAVVPVKEHQTLSDATTGAIEPDSITFPLCQKVIDRRIVVNELEIAAALREIASTERWIVEGAAGVAFAGLMRCAREFRGRKVAVVLCGRNIGIDAFLAATAALGKQKGFTDTAFPSS